MSEKKVGKRLLTWVLVLVMTLSLLPLNVLAAHPVGPAKIIRPDVGTYLTYQFYVDGTKVDEQIVKEGGTLLAPKTPEAAEGQRFIGWYDETNAPFTEFGEQSGITENKTIRLDAKFEEVYYVFFHAPGENGNIVKTKEGVTGNEITVNDVTFPVEHEESITGWYTDKNYATGTKVESVTLEKKNVDLYAKVETGHWITFDSNNGSYVAPQFVTDKTTEPTDPTRAGYTFAGWLLNGAAFTFGNKLDDDITLTAEWNAKNEVSYTVIHLQENANDGGYSYVESETKFGAANSETAATAKSYKGFTALAITQQTIAGDGSTIVNVKYKRNVYEVKFYTFSTWSFSGWSTPKEYTGLKISAKYGADISKQWPTHDGSSTWGTKENGGPYQVNIQTMPLGGAKFYGPKTGYGSETAYYYVEVLPGESGGTPVGGKYYKPHHKDTSPGWGYTVSKEDQYPIIGYTFNEKISTKLKASYDNAKFYYDRNSYNVVYVNNGETVKEQPYKFEASIADAGSYTPPRPEGIDAAYDFTGWYADPAGAQPYDFHGKTMPAQNITVYAKWEAPTFTVTVYDADKETILKTFENVSLRRTINKDDMPTVTLADGDTFLGWTYEDGTPFNFNTAITKDIKLYARVGNKTGYSVTYVTAEGSSPVTDDKLYAEGAYATVRDGASTAPAGKVFLYWNASSDSSGKKYYPNDKVLVPKGGVTLTAVYGNQSETVTLTYHANYPEGSNPADQSYSYNNNERITVKANMFPFPTGYVFDKWTTAQNGGDTYNPDAPARVDSEGSNDLYAQWKSTQITDEITVTIKGNTSTVTYDG